MPHTRAPHAITPRRIAALAAVAALCVLPLSGCSQPVAPPPAQPAATPSAPATSAMEGPGSSITPRGGISEMPDEIKLQINERFPVEYPVAAGDLISRSVRPDGSAISWDMAVPAPAGDVAQWYRDTMQARLFQLVDEQTSDDGAVVLSFDRSGVKYLVRITPTSETVSAVSSEIDAAM